MSVQPEDYTYVNFSSLEKAYEDLKGIVTELDRITDDLYADIKKTLGGAWEGEAEQYFDQKRAEWNAIEKHMGEQLFKAAVAVETAKGNYQQAEARNISIWMD
ncbi:WXG domain conatining protein [Nonomuraea coxensis DSM 45129]|uniref:WXG domain conatining protein n=1 Tax=Nonomuraea coxensis DSM 45129 TaxID=1122611 RepID=A0ABX8TTM9_9ACTN|nr:WXG100 family type VII secretion target [Nonomuraea coxensis]QYC38718.1 WXG domain conatining protein [Nonomuraea coxensis DSM 45129]